MGINEIENVSFHEEQSFIKSNRWIGITVYLLPLTMWYFVFEQVIRGNQIGTKPLPDVVILMLFFVIGIFVPWVILSARLNIEVRDSGVWFRYHPFQWKWVRIGFDDIKSARAITYRPILEYGGWGIRIGWGKRAYNVSGNEGVLFERHSSQTTILLGSRRAQELEAAIKSAQQKSFANLHR